MDQLRREVTSPALLFSCSHVLDRPNQPGYGSWFSLAIVDPSLDRHAVSPSRSVLDRRGGLCGTLSICCCSESPTTSGRSSTAGSVGHFRFSLGTSRRPTSRPGRIPCCAGVMVGNPGCTRLRRPM